jgi:nucleotide-binding universal stress UspA family protein
MSFLSSVNVALNFGFFCVSMRNVLSNLKVHHLQKTLFHNIMPTTRCKVLVNSFAKQFLLQRRFFANPADKPYGKPTTYRQGIWQGTPPPELLKPDEFWPNKALSFEPKIGLCSKRQGRKIIVGVGTSDWAGSVSALRTAFSMSTNDKDEIIVFNAPKLIADSRLEELMVAGQKTGALVKMVQEIAKEYNKSNPRIEMSPACHQPKIEVVRKVVAENADLVIVGHGQYPPNKMGNVASYLVLNAPCDVMVVKGGSQPISAHEYLD